MEKVYNILNKLEIIYHKTIFFLLYGKDVAFMADFLAYRIIDGKFQFKRVPKLWKEKVRQILIDMEAEELIIED